jgi:hypothetical protein
MDQLKQLLESHDWHYQRSDDHRVWKRGSEQRAAILNLVGAIGEEADELFKSYHQKEFPEVYQS